MIPSEILDSFRQQVHDVAEPYLWSDDELAYFLDDAQTMFCRLTDGIADATTPAATQVSIVPGQIWYPLHPAVKAVRSATRADTGLELDVVNQDEHRRLLQRWAGPYGSNTPAQPGVVRRLVLGAEENQIMAYPTPDETVTINLSIYRLPLAPITVSSATMDPQLGSQHHWHLMLWMKHLAYGKADSEVYDPRAAERYEQAFRDYCVNAKAEAQRRRRATTGTVVYGGL